MARCSYCGKKGLFLKVDSVSGLCNECIKKKESERRICERRVGDNKPNSVEKEQKERTKIEEEQPPFVLSDAERKAKTQIKREEELRKEEQGNKQKVWERATRLYDDLKNKATLANKSTDFAEFMVLYDDILSNFSQLAEIEKRYPNISTNGNFQEEYKRKLSEKQWHMRDAIEREYEFISKNAKGKYRNYKSKVINLCEHLINSIEDYRDTYDEETIAFVEDIMRKLSRQFGVETNRNTEEPIRLEEDFDVLEGHEFERWCAKLLLANGFESATVTQGSGDQGVDIIAKKEDIKYAIQCKCYSTDLGNTPIQEIVAGKTFYKCQIGVVMTNRYFSKSAVALADATGTLLWDRKKLLEMRNKCSKNVKQTEPPTEINKEVSIPDEASVDVEIPNNKVETVRLMDVLESPDAKKHPSRIAVGLGKDNSGRYIVADIAKMPHVLIAGQTGSGMSVCIDAIIVSILYHAFPEEVKLILIDPKVVELSIYNNIPHLVCPVVTDPKKAASALDWVVAEMTKRYKLFAEKGVRDIKDYNKTLGLGERIMPQMVIIIDELADLMMVSPDEVEDSICRLARLGGACGMHLVIATQRPSVNVITKEIKESIPTRIAFSVASKADSRTMIDHGGAEKLLGNGDMLFVSNGMKSMRVQGAWVSDDEVHAIVEYIKQSGEVDYDPYMLEHMENATRSDAEKEDFEAEYDPKLPEAMDIAINLGQVSIPMLQRKMRIGYARAGRIIDEMSRRGIVSEADGSKPRDVLITREQAKEMFEE